MINKSHQATFLHILPNLREFAKLRNIHDLRRFTIALDNGLVIVIILTKKKLFSVILKHDTSKRNSKICKVCLFVAMKIISLKFQMLFVTKVFL